MSFRTMAAKGMGFISSSSLIAMSALAESPVTPAGTAAPGANGAPAVNPLMNILPFVAMFGVMYFLIIRPQQKKQKEQQSMLSALKQGDDVVTASGILGRVTGLTDKVVTLEIDDKVRVKMLKSQVVQVLKGQDALKELKEVPAR